ncbi:MAG: methyltransferase domain-containing protein [Kofleriaceae bacterium]
MRMLLAVVAVAACKPPVAPQSPPPDADIIARSHAILEAIDRGEVAAVKPQLGAHYIHFEGSYADADKDLASIARSATDPASQIAKRTWTDERVFARGSDVIFIGKAKEKQGGNEVHGGYEFEGWYTLGWSREGDAWKLVYRGWQVAGATSEAATWNQIFHNKLGFEHAPNKLLVTYAGKHPPGTAVDVAMGQGRNAIYLASQGWSVTGVDISDEGVRQARDTASAQALKLDAVVADVTTYDYGTAKWDLVAMIYAYPALSKIVELQRATKPGGLFVYEFFADDDAPKPGELANRFAGWEILKDEIVEDVPDWRTDRAKIQRFVARKK